MKKHINPGSNFKPSEETTSKNITYVEERVLHHIEALSSDLNEYHSSFDNNEEIVIERDDVVKQLLDFVSEEPEKPEQSVLLLTGEAGMGKTVVMKQLLNRLKKQSNYLTISIKADRYSPKSIEEVNKDLGLSNESLFDFISTLAKQQSYNRIILLVDQIDALSQVLSNDRSPIEVYTRLISLLKQISCVRIIVSTRLFDSINEPLIKSLKKRFPINVPPLDDNSVKQTLIKAGYNGSISRQLFDFLRTPLHLRLFIMVGIKDARDKTYTLSKLYNALWTNIINEQKLELLTYLSNEMYEHQDLAINNDKLTQKGHAIIAKQLLSDGLLVYTEHNNQIQFLHQSLFDYTYARCFINSGKNLSDHLSEEHQGLFIRLRVKQILIYLREQNVYQYLREVHKILSRPEKYKFHIRLLIIQLLGGNRNLSREELDYVQAHILTNDMYRNYFLYSIYNIEWVSWLYDIDELSKIVSSNGDDYKSISYVFMQLPDYNNIDTIIALIEKLKSNHKLHGLIKELIERVNKPHTSLLIDVYQEIEPKTENQSSIFWRNIVEDSPEKCVDFFITYFRGLFNREKQEYLLDEHNFDQVLEDLFIKIPESACKMGLEIIHNVSVEHIFDYNEKDSLTDCYFYTDFNDVLYDVRVYDLLFFKTKETLISLLDQNTEWVKEEIKRLILSKYRVEVLLGVWISHTSEKITDDLCKIIFTEDKIWQSSRTILNYHLGLFIKKKYDVLSDQETQTFFNKIKNIEIEYEKTYFKPDTPTTKYGLTRLGQHAYQYLCCFPEKIVLNSSVKKFYLEQKRKYLSTETPPKPSSMKWSGDSTLPDEKLKELSNKDLIQLFKGVKSKWNEPLMDENRPTISGLSRSFYSLVTDNSERYFPLIKTMISEEKIDDTYIMSGLRALKEIKIDISLFQELYESILKDSIRKDSDSIELIWYTDYFLENKIMPEIVFNFLENRCLTIETEDLSTKKSNIFSDKEIRPYDLISRGINSNRGAAIERIMRCNIFPEYHERILKAIAKVAHDGTLATKAVTISQLALLHRINIDKALEIYLELVKDKNELLLGVDLNNLHPLIYLPNHNFDALVPIFKEAIKLEKSAKAIGVTLLFAWLNNHTQAKDLLWGLMSNITSSRWLAIIPYVFDHMKQDKYVDKCLTLYKYLISIDDSKLAESINKNIFKIKKYDNELKLKIVESYINSSASKYQIAGINSIIEEFIISKPRDVISWENTLLKGKYSSNDYFGYHKCLGIMINAYHTISKFSLSDTLLNEAIDTIDDALQHVQMRNASELASITQNDIWDK